MQAIMSLNDLYEKKVYKNAGNPSLLALIPPYVQTALDVGCGSGANAQFLKEQGCRVWGVTLSEAEAEIARPYMEKVFVKNVESEELELQKDFFDVIVCSHVLEHMIRPEKVLDRLCPLLKREGVALIAVPNMAHYRYRWRILRGNWGRDEDGAFDRTHYHFWSYQTIDSLFKGTSLQPIKKVPGDPSLPLWKLRSVLPFSLAQRFDRGSGRLFPNLCAGQVLVVARRL